MTVGDALGVRVCVLFQGNDKTAQNDSRDHEINQTKKQEGKKETIEGTWTRVQCEDTKREAPAEKRAII